MGWEDFYRVAWPTYRSMGSDYQLVMNAQEHLLQVVVTAEGEITFKKAFFPTAGSEPTTLCESF